MESLLVSTGAVALAEIGDKTQLLSLVLAARFRRPWPIIAGILLATLANHGVAAALGVWLSATISPEVLRWGIAGLFIGMGLWILVPDRVDEGASRYRYGPFLTTLVAFFLVEIGDKTQIATVALAARYDDLVMVVAGTTLGMLAANVPVIVIGDLAAEKLPMRFIRAVTALVFVALGVLTLSSGLSLQGR